MQSAVNRRAPLMPPWEPCRCSLRPLPKERMQHIRRAVHEPNWTLERTVGEPASSPADAGCGEAEASGLLQVDQHEGQPRPSFRENRRRDSCFPMGDRQRKARPEFGRREHRWHTRRRATSRPCAQLGLLLGYALTGSDKATGMNKTASAQTCHPRNSAFGPIATIKAATTSDAARPFRISTRQSRWRRRTQEV